MQIETNTVARYALNTEHKTYLLISTKTTLKQMQ
jgi:hypothetical protein